MSYAQLAEAVDTLAASTTGVFIQKLSFNGRRQLGFFFFDVDNTNIMFNADIDQRLDAPLIKSA